MGKVLLEFNAVAYRKRLIELKRKADYECLRSKGTLIGMSWESMRNAFDIALDSMEDFATFENVNNK